MRRKIKRLLSYVLTSFLWVISGFKKPIERDRWLFGGSGFGMLVFAIIIVIVVPFIIWFISFRFINSNALLGKYDTDISRLTGTYSDGNVVVQADSVESNTHPYFWSILSQYTDPGNLLAVKKVWGSAR